MSKDKTLSNAKGAKNDEFYTAAGTAALHEGCAQKCYNTGFNSMSWSKEG